MTEEKRPGGFVRIFVPAERISLLPGAVVQRWRNSRGPERAKLRALVLALRQPIFPTVDVARRPAGDIVKLAGRVQSCRSDDDTPWFFRAASATELAEEAVDFLLDDDHGSLAYVACEGGFLTAGRDLMAGDLAVVTGTILPPAKGSPPALLTVGTGPALPLFVERIRRPR